MKDELPEPENLTLSWSPDHFSLTAEWSEPSGLDDCKVNYTLELLLEKCPPSSTEPNLSMEIRQTANLKYTWEISNEREICVWVRTNPLQCGNRTPSKAVYKGISPPLAFVKNFACVYYSNMKMNCTWSVISHVPDLQLFYRLFIRNDERACSSYFTKEDMKTGCHLDDINFTSHRMFFNITGTVKGSTISNTFMRAPRDSVKPEPPNLKITRDGDRLHLQSDTPNFAPQCWKYKFRYSKCNEESEKDIEAERNPSLLLEYDAACKALEWATAVYPLCERKTLQSFLEEFSAVFLHPKEGLAKGDLLLFSSMSTPPPPTPEPMELRSNRLSPEERQRHFRGGPCLYCGGSNHLRRDCGRRPLGARAQPSGQQPGCKNTKANALSSQPPRVGVLSGLSSHTNPRHALTGTPCPNKDFLQSEHNHTATLP
ncbi:hypothetical protein MHYP_G00008500 [Metynnis hypsauchen]